MCERASAIVLVIACCLAHGSAVADPLLAEKMLGDGLLQQSAPIAAGSAAGPELGAAPPTLPVTAPVVAAPAEAPEPGGDSGDHGERRRVLSYIILQGLQGVGPFAGAR